MRCRTKSGTLKIYHEGEHHVLDGNGLDLPDELVESLRSHVNVIVGEDAPVEPVAAPIEPVASGSASKTIRVRKLRTGD